MTFEQYIAQFRKPVPRILPNPAVPADVLEKGLAVHLGTVRRWVDGKADLEAMLKAMKFFQSHFGSAYRPKEGRALYRGQRNKTFDGSPRSYSYDKWIAEGFAKLAATSWMPWKKSSAVLIQRRVCFRCADSAAFALALDLGKLLRAYAGHSYGLEKEVVVLNTEPQGAGAKLYLVEAA